VTIVNSGAASADVPVTVPNGSRKLGVNVLGVGVPGDAFGEAYAGERSVWQTLGKGGTTSVKLPA